MEKLNSLTDLLHHEITDLHSVEEQILAALPSMIAKAKNATLVEALQDHLRVTEIHKARLDRALEILGEANENAPAKERKGFLGLFSGKQKCRGMEGIIDEGKHVLNARIDPPVLDAAIIACAQKIEHYEICGYGTARAYARELGLDELASILTQTLMEEYDADDKLTMLAENRINAQAEHKPSLRSGSSSSRGKSGQETPIDTARRKELAAGTTSANKSAPKTPKPVSARRNGAPKKAAVPRSEVSTRGANRQKKTTTKATPSKRGSK